MHAAPFSEPPLPAGLDQRYDVRDAVGRGASGCVYRAWDSFAQREVALKIAHAQVFEGTPEQNLIRKAWLNEVHMAGSLVSRTGPHRRNTSPAHRPH